MGLLICNSSVAFQAKPKLYRPTGDHARQVRVYGQEGEHKVRPYEHQMRYRNKKLKTFRTIDL